MKGFDTPDARGWIGIACFVLVLIILAMMSAIPAIRQDEFFKVIATAIVLTAWIGGPVGWAFQATKTGGDLTNKQSDLVDKQTDVIAASVPPAAPDPVAVKGKAS